ncbi:protein Loquacious-like [Mytilus edulis]|uniref:protein Loquacious-like n=1 Tax=Mytilus edulis TaxID=6550 RepID=UPI0039EEC3AC
MSVQSVLSLLVEVRENVDCKVLAWYEEAVVMGKEHDIVPSVPRTCSRQRNRCNVPGEAPDVYFRRALCIPYIDELISGIINDRFSSLSKSAVMALVLIPEMTIQKQHAHNNDNNSVYIFSPGTGRSKKEAKRAAALAMLTHIRSLTQDGEEQAVIEEEEEEDDILLSATELRQSYTALKEGKKRVPIPAAKQNKEIQQFYNKIAKVDKKNGKIKNASLTAPSTNYCQMLQEIAEAQRFEVNYLDIEETSHSGLRQCLVQLSTLPVAVLHGSGQNIYDAHAHAAHNALQYLRLMIKS